LNAVLRGRVAYLPYIWNFQAKTVAKDAEAIGVPEPMLQKMARQPRIVHYTGAKKPWRYIYHVPFEREYFRYLRRTPWRAYRPPDRTLRTVLGRHLSPLRWAYRKMRPHRMPASVANHA
jgi:lipopolysaccharide biosynthesis glycosyltransferase